ncbi:regulator of telomere elongation helicase 1 isoform X1 [Nelusetta ayraudi]|uniref:regulator of telomere elongation helicase 1 isoform X1 n=1 Tax=Nelusetta ayraudi TaxID=303726 RepID=UPI003F6E87F6
MQQLTLNGVPVNFPFPPYDCQRTYMSKVIECLQKKVNGVLESPTGTGKTLCLLCATLAWREHVKDSQAAQKIAQRLGGDTMLGNTDLSSWCTSASENPTELPKIIYATRTHSQLAQVITELKNTSYRPKVCVLGSREQLCINPEVQREPSNHVKVHMCRRKVSTRSCVYYNNFEEKLTDRDLVNSILDVEDLVRFGNKQRACPYYLSRSLKQQADIIFMPYNYLLDPKSRRAHNIALNGAVILFDEAHNLEKACEEQTSFDLTPYDLASAIDVVNRLLVEQARDAGRGEALTDTFSDDSSTGLKLDLAAVAKIKQILIDLEGAIDSYEVSQDKGLTKPGVFIYELLERAHLNYSSKAAVSEALEQIIGHLTAQTGVFVNTSGLQKLADIIQLVFTGEPDSNQQQQQQKQFNTAHFKVHIHRDKSFQHKKPSADVWASSSVKKQGEGNILSYWCFSPGFSMQELVNQGVHCIVLTSGTLSPLSSFTSEMRIEFPVHLENGHVIERDQIFVGVIPQGPDGVHLSSAFDRRFAPDNMSSLGNSIVNLSRVVPHGLLVFFPSFPLMEKTLDFWRANGHADRIESLKPLFVEPKGKSTFTAVIDGYCSKVKDPVSRGGAFFAVCRGKVSEGLDFSDSLGRGVIITGLPFPPRMDPRVILKMQFLDENSTKRTPGIKYLSGQQWYKQQAFRAVNQAIGRVIRHRDDFGAIFLCDQRFRSADAMAQLPSWLKPCVSLYDSFGSVVRDVSKFFRIAQKRMPVVKAVAPDHGGLPDSQSAAGSTCSSLPSSSRTLCDAKVLDTHILSMKRKRLNEPSRPNGTARMCIEYEREDPQSLKKPVNLLDALEHSDHSRRKEDEEKANSWSGLSLLSGQRSGDDVQECKRKIALVKEKKRPKSEDVSQESGESKAKSFLAEMKKTLSQVNFNLVVRALQSYKTSDDLQALLTATAFLSEDGSTHSLLQGICCFVRPHHKKTFDEKSKDLTGQSCGLKFAPSLAEAGVKTQSTETHAAAGSLRDAGLPSVSVQLDTQQQLNQGRKHLSQHQVRNPQPGSSSKSQVHSSFLADVKKALGPEKMALLFQSLDNYKKSNDYDNLVTTVVSLFTEKDEDFHLLVRFGAFVRPQHKQQFEQMLDALRGTS